MAEVIGVTSNVLKRVVRIVVGQASGTAFTLDVDGHQYLITAKHVVAGLLNEQSKIQVCGDGGCTEREITVLRCDDPIDIAVLVPNTLLTVTYDLPADSNGIILGQDVYFVGFPYADPALVTSTAAKENVGFVRKAIWSAQERKDGFTRYYFDGRNNFGFSGAPIVYLQQGQAGFNYKLAAVVSGYRSDFTEVMKSEPISNDKITSDDIALGRIIDYPDGSHAKLVPTGLVVQGNTGIVIGYDIQHAVDLIRKKQIKGPSVK